MVVRIELGLSHHQDGLLHLAGVPDKVVHRFQRVVILFPLLVDFHGFLKILHHVLGGEMCIRDSVCPFVTLFGTGMTSTVKG